MTDRPPVAPTTGPWRIATRRSHLAQVQAGHVGQALETATGRPYELVPMATTGDEHPDRALDAFDAKGLFVDRTRGAVLAGDCHLVVHSYKDLPTEAHPDLTIGGVPARVDPRDALVTRAGWRLADLPRDRQVVIGTSSPRRRAQIAKHRRDVLVQPIRGNIETRLGKVARGEVDGVVLALAGILRARPDVPGLTVVPLEHGEMLHAPAQGALALECRVDDAATRKALRKLDHEDTRSAVTAEREVLLQLQGGCTAPIGAHAEVRVGPTGEKRIELLGLLSDPSGTSLYRASHETGASEPHLLGRVMAATLLEAGGDRVLERLRAADGA
ncbi:hydroxymethylbilane synthase [Nitriliruptor alkaliphilus]|uniref:hydroxymethylbilane synthase n=1 Tax=Nitriliruptor alkaliphilus TaxID=427918 RepID=UPI000698476D|nr:hydroxymethylbilane synthase [Nitriliruptor alkaliphilus]